MTEKCAGILFFTPDNKVLLLHRNDRDEWEGPGGHLEPNESELDAAIRETKEEAAIDARTVARDISKIGVTNSKGVSYTTFKAAVSYPFKVKLNHEHDDAQWFSVESLPSTTHPGAKEIIQEVVGGTKTTEWDVIKAMKAGELDSPQRYGPLWLFKVRVTGTGVSYRPQHSQYVYRPPEFYLNDEFLERVKGLPILLMHTENGPAQGAEYHQRNIGTLVAPWVEGSDVWGIAKVYDDGDAQLIVNYFPSTSPSITVETPDGSTVDAGNGEEMLIEGEPVFIDHLAMVPEGVWDKLQGPSGVDLRTVTDSTASGYSGPAPYSWRP